MGILNVQFNLIDKFLSNFQAPFSKKQFNIFRLFILALFKDYKRNSLEQIATNFKINYQKFQYFFSDSPWNYESLNLKRLNLLKRQRTTHFNKDGLLVIDDTGVLKPYAQNTQGVKFQYCPSLKTEALCNVAVASCFVQGQKHIPLNLKFYQPEEEFDFGKEDVNFKSKLTLAQELVQDALQKNIPFSYVVFDS